MALITHWTDEVPETCEPIKWEVTPQGLKAELAVETVVVFLSAEAGTFIWECSLHGDSFDEVIYSHRSIGYSSSRRAMELVLEEVKSYYDIDLMDKVSSPELTRIWIQSAYWSLLGQYHKWCWEGVLK